MGNGTTLAQSQAQTKRWGESCVHWKEYVTITLGLIVGGCGLFGFILNMHASQPHTGAATVEDVERANQRMDRIEKRNKDLLQRIEMKVDRLLLKKP